MSGSLRRRLKNSAARRRFRASPAYARTKVFLKRIAGKELWLRPEVHPALFLSGDWALCPDLLPEKNATVYSFGIGDSIACESLLIDSFGVEVHGFDPTPSVESLLTELLVPSGFHYYPWALAGQDETIKLYPRLRGDGVTPSGMYTLVGEAGSIAQGISVEAKRLSTIMAELGHETIDVLKMDIEGAEYEVLSDVLESTIRPTQILVEFHHRFESIGKEKTRTVIQQLGAEGYQVAFVSQTGRELTFVLSQ